MTSSHLRPRIWSTISWRNCMTRLGSGTQIQVAFWWQNKAFKWSKGSIQGALSACSNTLRSSETMLFVFLPISTKRLCLIRMWLSYASTITLWIVPLHTLWPVGSVQAAAQLQISYCEDGMHWLDSCSKICIVGGYFLALWSVDRWVIIWSFWWGFGSLFGVLFI